MKTLPVPDTTSAVPSMSLSSLLGRKFSVGGQPGSPVMKVSRAVVPLQNMAVPNQRPVVAALDDGWLVAYESCTMRHLLYPSFRPNTVSRRIDALGVPEGTEDGLAWARSSRVARGPAAAVVTHPLLEPSRVMFAWTSSDQEKTQLLQRWRDKPMFSAARFVPRSNEQAEFNVARAKAGDTHLFVWSDDVEGVRDEIRGAVAVVDGDAVVSQPSFVVAEGAGQGATESAGLPVVAAGDDGWVVAWVLTNESEGVRSIHARGVVLNGSLGESPPVKIAEINETYGSLDMASSGTDFLLVWHHRQAGTEHDSIRAARLDEAGAVIGEVFDVFNSNGEPASQPEVAWEPFTKRYVVVWTSRPAGDLGRTSLRARWFAWKGEKAGSPTMGEWNEPLLGTDSALSNQSETSIAMGRAHTMLVWRDDRSGESQIYGALFEASGSACIGSSFAISQGRGAKPTVTEAAEGHGFLVAWEGSQDGGVHNIYGATVTTDCEVRDLPGVPLSAREGHEREAKLARAVEGKMVLAYLRDVPLPVGSRRVECRVVDSGIVDGQPCTDDVECISRRCTDGVCCREECAACERCGVSGNCEPVTNEEDDLCNGALRCDLVGECKSKEGERCVDASECASGFCADGVCCNTACEGSCARCDQSPGLCISQNCHPYGCDAERLCFDRCLSSRDCAPGLQCFSSGRCEPPLAASPSAGWSCRWGGPSPRAPTPWLLSLGLLLWRRRWRP